MNVPIIVTVQALYALRLWRLNYRRDWIPRLMPLILVIATAIGILLAVRTWQLGKFTELPAMAWITYSSFGSAAVVDSILAAATVYYLRRARGEFETTNSRIAKLVFWTLSTGVITSVCSLAALVAYALFPHKLYFLAIEFLLTKLYMNSLLAMLNARKSIREGSEISINQTRSNHSNAPTSPSSPRSRPLSVLPSPMSVKGEYLMQPIPMVHTLQVNDSAISVNYIKTPPVARAV
jgi:NAD/NADP transhydrogenase beta subunit